MRLRPWLIALTLIAIFTAIGFALRGRFDQKPQVSILSVPPGDREVAWFHTSTSFAAWEHFVASTHRAAAEIPELEIDDSSSLNDGPLQTDVQSP